MSEVGHGATEAVEALRVEGLGFSLAEPFQCLREGWAASQGLSRAAFLSDDLDSESLPLGGLDEGHSLGVEAGARLHLLVRGDTDVGQG